MKYFVEGLKCGLIRPEQKRFSAPPCRLRVESSNCLAWPMFSGVAFESVNNGMGFRYFECGGQLGLN
jgi:hypothetical protein